MIEQFQQAVVVGRAATALYLILQERFAEPGGLVLLPANICYAAIYPVLYAGHRPVFCDVDERTGNVTFETVSRAIEVLTQGGNGKTGAIDASGSRISAAILPHMYGNPIAGMDSIIDCLKQEGTLIIEDCASAMGATYADGAPVGSRGDYAVYSTGYSKTVDVGFGGLVTSKAGDLGALRAGLCELPVFSEELEERDSLLSLLYRQLRNGSYAPAFVRGVFAGLREPYRDVFLNRLTEEQEQRLVAALDNLPEVVAKRRTQEQQYCRWFAEKVPEVGRYQFADGAVPWRFSFFVPQERRRCVVEKALERSVPVSDWYPCSAVLFQEDEAFPAATAMGERILNLPLLIDERDQERAAQGMIEALTL